MERKTKRRKSRRAPVYGKEDEVTDCKSAFTEGLDGAQTVAPTEYSTEADYRTDEAATVMDWTETLSVHTGQDGAETATVYTRQDGDETATMYDTRQDGDGTTTVYTSQDETITGADTTTTAKQSKKRKCIIKVTYATMLVSVLFFGLCMYFIITSTAQTRTSSLLSAVMIALDEMNQLRNQLELEKRRAVNIFKQVIASSTAFEQQVERLLEQVQQNRLQVSRILSVGRSSEVPTLSCKSLPSYYPSGYYFIRSGDGLAVRVYCDMTLSCNGIIGGWTRLAEANFGNDSEPCPVGFFDRFSIGTRSCVAPELLSGCTSLTLSQVGYEYNEVCGTVIAYQVGHPDAFSGQQNTPITGSYLDGVTLHRGTAPPKHIWSFAAARDEATQSPSLSRCPCMSGGDSPQTRPPPFVGNHYFCDTASEDENTISRRFYAYDLLWDGTGCGRYSQCCSFNNPPLFYRVLPERTREDITMSFCINVPFVTAIGTENIALRRYAIYVS